MTFTPLGILMYHRVGRGKYSNPYEMLASHLKFVKKHYPIVLPGDPLLPRKVSLCLCFDDASFDFYHFVFPLLKKLDLRVLLAVPPKYILNSTTLTPEERLSVPYYLAMQEKMYEEKAPFATWEELKEMASSGCVEMASHSYSHPNLTYPYIDAEQEVVLSKKILEEKLPQAITSFVYPFGKVNGAIHRLVTRHYPYTFRIGGALNFNWKMGKFPLTRLSADNLTTPDAILSIRNLSRAFLKGVIFP